MNKQIIKDQIDAASHVRIRELERNPTLVPGNFDKKHLLRIHGYIFQDASDIDADFSKTEIKPGQLRSSSPTAWMKERKLEDEGTPTLTTTTALPVCNNHSLVATANHVCQRHTEEAL